MYRPYLADAIRLALESGRRREEIVNMRFSDIVPDNDGFSFIKVEDRKVNRIRNRTRQEDKKYVLVPVTDSLQKLLFELGLEQYRDTDNYILAPDEKISRGRIMCDALSRGFSHYYAQLNTGKELSFKCLRKTYLSQLQVFTQGNAKIISGHSDDAVLEKFYLDKSVIAKAAKGFVVFPKADERKQELQQIRSNGKNTHKQFTIEK